MSIRTITLTIELDDDEAEQGQLGYSVALNEVEVAERRLRGIFLDHADIRVMEFSREAKP